MSTPQQTEMMDLHRPEVQSHQQSGLWMQLPIAEQQQLARHWARLIQQIRQAHTQRDKEARNHGT